MAWAGMGWAARPEGINHSKRDVGYDNESSFSKAFEMHYGNSPGAFRAEWSA
jgi:AraC-like DNA-binding protein